MSRMSIPPSIFNHLDLELVGEWDDLKRRKLIAQPFNNEVMSPNAHEGIQDRILAAVAEIANSQGVGVATLHTSAEAEKSKQTPTVFMVYNITDEQANILLDCHIWSSQSITFCITPLGPACPDFLFTTRKISTLTNKDIEETMKRVWNSETVKNDQETS
jgi:hypothetical protein